MDRKKRTVLLKILDGLAVLGFILTFSPLIIPPNETRPDLWGIPYTLWTSFLVGILFVMLAYLVSTVNKEDDHVD